VLVMDNVAPILDARSRIPGRPKFMYAWFPQPPTDVPHLRWKTLGWGCFGVRALPCHRFFTPRQYLPCDHGSKWLRAGRRTPSVRLRRTI